MHYFFREIEIPKHNDSFSVSFPSSCSCQIIWSAPNCVSFRCGSISSIVIPNSSWISTCHTNDHICTIHRMDKTTGGIVRTSTIFTFHTRFTFSFSFRFTFGLTFSFTFRFTFSLTFGLNFRFTNACFRFTIGFAIYFWFAFRFCFTFRFMFWKFFLKKSIS